jgi:tRNA 2-thiocytidine biosynthesis protein TtcA
MQITLRVMAAVALIGNLLGCLKPMQTLGHPWKIGAALASSDGFSCKKCVWCPQGANFAAFFCHKIAGMSAPSLPIEDLPGRPEHERRLARALLGTLTEYSLIAEGDRILVAVSGGKDSYTLLDLLWQARRRAPVRFDLVAVHLDQGQPGYDGEPLRAWLARFGAPFEILRVDTYPIVLRLSEGGGTYCAPCSRLRRGALYGAAERLGCNKVALGHHREDALETLLMNLLYGGRLQAMPARYRTDDGRFEVIRPLIECAEADIAAYAAARGYPILPCNLCGSQEGLKREAVARLIDGLEAEVPDVRAVMLRALKNVHPGHLLDAEVASAWAQGRAAAGPPAGPAGPGDRSRPAPSWRRALRVLDS